MQAGTAASVVLICAGVVFASAMPWILSHIFGFAGTAPLGVLPPSLRVAYYLGAVGMLASVGLTVATTSERPPGSLKTADGAMARPEWAPPALGRLSATARTPPLSLVDPEAPDLTRFPCFAEALEAAKVAELGPGDALLLPRYWWHHVTSRDRYNAIVTCWRGGSPRGLDDPRTVFLAALLALRDPSERERDYWRAMFEAYIFDRSGEALAHLPPALRGYLGALGSAGRNTLRRQLQTSIFTA